MWFLLTVDSSSASAMTFEPSAMPGRYLGFSCVLFMISVSLEPCRHSTKHLSEPGRGRALSQPGNKASQAKRKQATA